MVHRCARFELLHVENAAARDHIRYPSCFLLSRVPFWEAAGRRLLRQGCSHYDATEGHRRLQIDLQEKSTQGLTISA